MKINVAKAKQQIGGVFPFDYTVTSEKLGLDSDTTWRKSQIVVSGEFVNNGQKIEVRGLIQSSGIFTCSRCLEDISIDLKIPFLESFFEEGVKVDDEDIVVYTDDEIEIDDLNREYLILAEPNNPVCNSRPAMLPGAVPGLACIAGQPLIYHCMERSCLSFFPLARDGEASALCSRCCKGCLPLL